MRLRTLTLQHFRNIALARLELAGRRQFLVGANGQGKTNFLEAAGFLTALRSFRGNDASVLIGHGQAEAAIACTIEHERLGETVVTMRLRPGGKEVQCDGTRVTRLADYLGRFPTVVFSSQDQLLMRGAPALRRRWLDLTLAALDAGYLRALQTFHRALAERNSLLKQGKTGAAELGAFEHVLAPAAAELTVHRAAAVPELAGSVEKFYAQLAADAEPVGMVYVPSFAATDAASILTILEKNRGRDAQWRTTLAGPHRDDVEFTLGGRGARDFASEGQQRSLVLALRLAQAEFFQKKSGVTPVLLADDVLGELDPARRRRFWAALTPDAQVIATGTSLPEGEAATSWQVFTVRGGEFCESPAVTEKTF
ncbi:MAG TPA: DNA replication/repair protein RecF [Opitutaceae bacterium]|jgi:DNA replication and repair protein RecF|nr:DNA replication/repair protein RecF [Opitutaceae bacterium]